METIDEISSGVQEGFDRLIGGLSAEAVFGAPQEIGERIVFTAAAIERMGGFGFGGGFDESAGGGGGGGGGGRAEGRPVAVIEIDDAGVRIQPVIDVTRIGVTVALALLALLKGGRGG
ncbi:MAG: hypothetical protein ACE5MI_04910 [Acidimicrobiia bacterium]